MKQRNQKHIALLSVVLVPALLLSACGSGASGQLSSSSTAPGSEPAVSVSQPEPEPQPAVTALRFSATGDNLIHDGLYLQARSRAGGEGYDFTALYENVAPFYKDFDINWINQETLVTDELPPSSYPCFCTPGASPVPYHYVYDRHAERRKREPTEIGIHAVRGGSIVGEHEVIFAGPEEVITISHSAGSREVFANGALNAAVFLAGKPAGMYNMKDLMHL